MIVLVFGRAIKYTSLNYEENMMLNAIGVGKIYLILVSEHNIPHIISLSLFQFWSVSGRATRHIPRILPLNLLVSNIIK